MAENALFLDLSDSLCLIFCIEWVNVFFGIRLFRRPLRLGRVLNPIENNGRI
ncbi:hypothetical protein HMPREF9418_2319 [Neisseria macacae ATCC 33926]|uniref:Uncharacterized protein n=1 Tax=Neisseria macacae ATCC 33926 TaxID=997348 RepID=A0AA36XJL2_9NEIS|nr:hypothetical protein HMPREF9418_2319 [Neisseria macacae ATCC 33926]